MWQTWTLSNGQKIVSDSNSIALLSSEEIGVVSVYNAMIAGRIVINTDHVVSVMESTKEEIEHYNNHGY